MVVVVLRPSGRGRGGAGRATFPWCSPWCRSTWRTWTRSTWSETPGAPDSAAPSTAPGAAANGRLADRSPSADPRPGLPMPQPGCVPRGCGSGFAAHDSGRELAPVWRFTGLLMSTPLFTYDPVKVAVSPRSPIGYNAKKDRPRYWDVAVPPPRSPIGYNLHVHVRTSS